MGLAPDPSPKEGRRQLFRLTLEASSQSELQSEAADQATLPGTRFGFAAVESASWSSEIAEFPRLFDLASMHNPDNLCPLPSLRTRHPCMNNTITSVTETAKRPNMHGEQGRTPLVWISYSPVNKDEVSRPATEFLLSHNLHAGRQLTSDVVVVYKQRGWNPSGEHVSLMQCNKLLALRNFPKLGCRSFAIRLLPYFV